MFTARIRHYFNAPIEKVFECVSDHEGYSRFTGVAKSRLLRPGDKDRNGLGAVREVVGFPVRFLEEITVFEPPTRMEYRVMECHLSLLGNTVLVRLHLDHHLGRMNLVPQRGGTEVEWISRGETWAPLIGNRLDGITKKKAETAFLDLLKDMDRSLGG